MNNDGIKRDIDRFSPHLFWDMKRSMLMIEEHKEIIIERVVLNGTDKDEYLMLEYYSRDDIIKVVKNIKSMPDKICNWLSFRLGIPKEDFRCYEQIQWI
jgi:hypothetical protein